MTESFTSTSSKPYDQCYYELYFENGTKRIWEDYEELRDYWISRKGSGMSHVNVKRKATSQSVTKKRPTGFA